MTGNNAPLAATPPPPGPSRRREHDAPAWPPEFLDLGGLAHELSVSTRQARRLLAAGRLPAADVNLSPTGGLKGRRWRREKVVAWVAAARVDGPDRPEADQGGRP